MLYNVPYLFEGFITISILAFVIYIWFNFKKENFSKFVFDRMVISLAIGGALMAVCANMGNRLFHFLSGTPWKETQGITFLAGLVGGLIGFVICFLIFLKDERKKLLYYINSFIAGIALAHGIGRIGCFLAGCCYGKITESFLGICFPVGSPVYYDLVHNFHLTPNIASVTKVLPTQLFEAIFCFLLFAALLFIKKHRTNIYLISYGIFRFFIEYLRIDNRGSIGMSLSPSQLLSIVCVVLGILLFVWELLIEPRMNSKQNESTL